MLKNKNNNERINHIYANLLKIKSDLNEIIKESEYRLNKSNKYYKNKLSEVFNIFSINKIPFNIFNEQINKKYIQELNYFCDNQDLFRNQDYENEIQMVKIHLNNSDYYMNVYKGRDIVSRSIIKNNRWNPSETNKIIYALNYYKNKTNIDNNNIYILDIGANIGWYSIFLGKQGYRIISFEPNEKNYYILKKNFCLNREIKLSIINKGLYGKEEECDYYEQGGNIGNGMIICDDKKIKPNQFNKKGTISLTRLSTIKYIYYVLNSKTFKPT